MTKHFKITDDELREAVKQSSSVMEVLRFLGLREAGGSNSHYKKRILKLEIDISHFLGKSSNKDVIPKNKKTYKDILVLSNTGRREKSTKLVRALLETGRPHECEKCGIGPVWMGNKLTLEVDHINEDWLDHRPENLRFLCPNCHSQFSRKLIRDMV